MLDKVETKDGTVGKALALLDDVAEIGRPVRFSELLADSKHPKATLYRLLRTLTNQQMLAYDEPTQTYSLGSRLVRLAHTAWRDFSLAPVARPHLDALSKTLRTTVHLAQLDAGQVLYIDKRSASDPIEMFSSAGKVGPAYCTGVGKAMLAHLNPGDLDTALSKQSFFRYTDQTVTDAVSLKEELAEIRMAGHAFDREEHEPTIICAAVPILAASGRAMGGLSITGTTRRITLKTLGAAVPTLKETARRIADAAEAWRFPDDVGSAP